jgi:hypothetical protein
LKNLQVVLVNHPVKWAAINQRIQRASVAQTDADDFPNAECVQQVVETSS